MLAPRLDGPLALQGGRMTKADLVEKVTAHIARTAGPLISKKDCARVVDSFLDAVKAALAEQHNIEVRGFGTFKIRQRKTRMANLGRSRSASGRRAWRVTQELVIPSKSRRARFLSSSPARSCERWSPTRARRLRRKTLAGSKLELRPRGRPRGLLGLWHDQPTLSSDCHC